MFYLYHRLGIQSNVVVAARYASTEPGEQRLILSEDAVFAALHTVVTANPELGLVGVIKPEETGTHLLSLAALHTVDLESCVEFIDNDDQKLDAEFFENLHSQWLWADGKVKPGVPWWKVIILGRRDVVFLFHHLVCDGAFGMTFHREFLAALNAAALSDTKLQNSRKVELKPQELALDKSLQDTITRKPPVFGVIYNLLKFLFFRSFYSKKLFFGNFPKPKALLKSPLAVAQAHDRTVTKVTTYRIPAEKTDAIIAACRAHGTTLTPLLIVMIAGTLATDFYPKAEVGFTRYAVDMRATGCFESSSTGGGKLLNLAASIPEPEWLKKYRRAFPLLPVAGEKSRKNGTVDPKAAWKLVQDYGRRMKDTRAGGESSQLYKAWISGNALGPTLEEFVDKSLPSMGFFMQNTFSVSNVGALKPASSSPAAQDPVVRIEDVQFSAGPIQGGAGYHGIVFNVAGVAGGDTVINACAEEGMAPEGMSSAVLDGVMARIDALLQ